MVCVCALMCSHICTVFFQVLSAYKCHVLTISTHVSYRSTEFKKCVLVFCSLMSTELNKMTLETKSALPYFNRCVLCQHMLLVLWEKIQCVCVSDNECVCVRARLHVCSCVCAHMHVCSSTCKVCVCVHLYMQCAVFYMLRDHLKISQCYMKFLMISMI